MPAISSHLVSLALRISASHDTCSACQGEDHQIIFVLNGVEDDGEHEDIGVAICPDCAARHGYLQAIELGLTYVEDFMLGIPAKDRGISDNEVREEFVHYRGLAAHGMLTTPPPIPTKHFAEAGAA